MGASSISQIKNPPEVNLLHASRQLWCTKELSTKEYECNLTVAEIFLLKHLWYLMSLGKIRNKNLIKMTTQNIVKQKLGHNSYLLKDKEAYIVETSEIEGSHVLPRDNTTTPMNSSKCYTVWVVKTPIKPLPYLTKKKSFKRKGFFENGGVLNIKPCFH